MNTNELASAYVSEFGPCASVDAEWAGTAFSEAYDNEEGKYFDEFLLELDAKVIRESAPGATEEKIARWKDRLPERFAIWNFRDTAHGTTKEAGGSPGTPKKNSLSRSIAASPCNDRK